MTIERAAEKLRHALDLCSKALQEETDPEAAAGLRNVVHNLEAALWIVEQSQPSVPLNE